MYDAAIQLLQTTCVAQTTCGCEAPLDSGLCHQSAHLGKDPVLRKDIPRRDALALAVCPASCYALLLALRRHAKPQQ
jgi:hypothetical protein